MNIPVSIIPEQFIFTQGDELITTSLKVAEAFGKRHDNILRLIGQILTQVSDSFGKLNFEESEYEQENNLGLMTKYRSYNMTKDGFMMLIMGFTGQKAMGIKEAYINAFNAMYEKLFPRVPLLEPPTITKAQQGELATRVSFLSGASGKTKAAVWSRFSNHFRISGYKNLPVQQYDEALTYLERLRVEYGGNEEVITMTKTELLAHDAQIAEDVVKRVQGDLVNAHKYKIDDSFPENCRILETRVNGYTESKKVIPEKALIHTAAEFMDMVEMRFILIDKDKLKTLIA